MEAQKKNRANDFIVNTIILFIGKFATQFISFLLLPLYTRYLIAKDYGAIDLIQTYITLFVPLLSLRLDSAVFRFLIDKRNSKKEQKIVVSNVFYLLFLCTILTTVIGIILNLIFSIRYFILILINIIILMISGIFLQILRGIGKNKQYSISCIITAVITLICNYFLIVHLSIGAIGIIISSTIANVACVIYISLYIDIFKSFQKELIDKQMIKQLLSFSLPMIPNSLSWWIVNVSDRSLISIFLGVSFNGIYTVSSKFSNILNSIFSIVNMSWQETASLHINDKDNDLFFSKMINSIFYLFCSISLLIIAVLPFMYNFIIGKDYLSSYNYIPILLYSNIWNVFIGLIGGIYVALKKTKQIANTTIVSSIINIIINLALIKFIGLYAACISTLLSYLIMSIYRYIDCKKYIKIKMEYTRLLIFTFIYCISTFVYYKNHIILNIIDLIFVLIYLFIVNKSALIFIRKNLKRK